MDIRKQMIELIQELELNREIALMSENPERAYEIGRACDKVREAFGILG